MVSLRRRLLAAAAIPALLVAPSAARAEAHPSLLGPGDFKFHLRFYTQAHVGTAAALADWKHPGGIALRGGFSLLGLGLAAALRFERVAGAPGTELSLAAQLRPLALAESRVYRIFDPFVSLGGELGGGGGARGAMVTGGGFDIALFPGLATHPAITVDYQVRPLRTPADLPRQLFQVGPTLRWVDP
jgi:hypothetical protein